jgi:hypothetical protein
MRPVRTERSNKVFTAPAGQEYEVRDLHVEVDLDEPRWVKSVWEPTPEEREQIANGANIALFCHGQPPVSLEVTSEQGYGEDDPIFRERLRALRVAGS